MVPPEPGSPTLYGDNSRLRPLVSGPSPLSTDPFSDHYPSSMSGYDSTHSNRSQASKGGVLGADQDIRRDSHDLSMGGRGRDSLLDNLLLSFDKIGDGTFGNFNTSPFFSNIDEVDDDESLYSRRGRADSIGYHSQYSASAPRQIVSAHEEGSFGVTYDSSRDTRSRGRSGLNSSHGYANGYEPAPAPSIRTRNRTPSPPRSPRLVRRPSNKSLRSRDQQFSHHHPPPSTLPPLPAFAGSPLPPAVPMAPSKSSGRPGFFRRVFGGGSNSSSGSANTIINSAKTVNNTAGPGPAIVNSSSSHTTESPQSVITKKSSFFRRRKKSVSDVSVPPIPVAPVLTPMDVPDPPPPPPADPVITSPSISLRTAMNPYIHTPHRPANLESTMEDRETAYLARNATIRTVASSDPISPRRPSFFSESPRGRETGSYSTTGKLDGSGKKYQKETWVGAWETGGNIEEQGPSKDAKDRPQTSPYSPLGSRTFFLDEDEGDVHRPSSPPFCGKLSGSKTPDGRYLAEGHGSVGSLGKAQKAAVASGGDAIVDIREIEKQYSKEESKQKTAVAAADKPTPLLGIDTTNLKPTKPNQSSWIISPITPTVTLQKDGPIEVAEILGSDNETESRLDDGLPEPTGEDKEMARKIFDGDEEFVSKERAAAWLGDPGPERAVVLKAYMRLFCWSRVNILQAMRIFCGRVVFKGETQQVDRIMVAFAHRWCECNQNHGFKSADVVHTIIYSLLLLNTDLHLADIPSSQKMTRVQFMKNTMSTIRRGVQEAAAIIGDLETVKAQSNTMPPRSQTPFRGNTDDESILSTSATFPLVVADAKGHKTRTSLDFGRDHKGSRLSRIGNIGNLSPRIAPEDAGEKCDFGLDGGNALVNAPLSGGLRLWETQIEIVLKDFYNSVKGCALPLHGSAQGKLETPYSNGLSVFGAGGMLRRSPSNISKAPSEMSNAGKQRENNKNLGTKWASKNRSRQRVYNGSFAGSSRTSLEDRAMWSPSASSTWSKYTLDKTQTSMSVDSLGSAFTHAGDYQQSIGFANALSNAIIREEGASATSAEDGAMDPLDGGDELELEGAPWAKEGLLKHKHHLESVDKRAKNRGWIECFAVIQRGYMRLFQFPSKAGKSPQFAGRVVGGGNWTENAEPIGSFLLRQSIASALPPPGYSKTRPNVWALSLPSGAVHFFEAGTADIVKEFVTTANYWSARLSKEPLIGGVSNVEYGWGECLVNIDTSCSSPPHSIHNEGVSHGRTSLQMSIRSSIDHGTIRPRLPGDKVHIKDWSPPSQSMVASSLAEKDQLKALENYVLNIETDLSKHNELRHAMQLAFTPRHPNSSKALNNWEKKSSYLLREIIKFRTYIETLQSAIQRRQLVDEKRISWAAAKKDANVTEKDVAPRSQRSNDLDLELNFLSSAIE